MFGPTISPTQQKELFAYQTQTPMRTENPTQITKPAIEAAPPAPTATPFLYKIVENDTFSAIAKRNGIELNDLIAANPNIDPNFLLVGITITIPINGTAPILVANNPTPIPLSISNLNCYPTAERGLWCLASIQNEQPYDLENISAEFSLNFDGETAKTQMALLPLNVLRSGEVGILATYFHPPINQDFQVQVNMLSALTLDKDSNRYLTSSVTIKSTEISDDGSQAIVAGEVFNKGTLPSSQIWLAAIAVDKNEKPIGFRKWESNNLLSPGESQPFEIIVYALGSQISNVSVFSELRP